LNDLDSALKFSIEVEGRKKLEDVENYDEVYFPFITT
jgi:DNA polymerase epsilon subunit 1